MAEETKQQEATTEVKTSEQVEQNNTEATTADAPAARDARPGNRRHDRGDRNQRRNPRRQRRGGKREERARSEFDQKIVSIRRVTRVMAGGRRFSFSVAMVIGNKKGKVGVGIGKASDTQLAIEKAARNAKKNLIEVPMNKEQHIPHDVHAKYA